MPWWYVCYVVGMTYAEGTIYNVRVVSGWHGTGRDGTWCRNMISCVGEWNGFIMRQYFSMLHDHMGWIYHMLLDVLRLFILHLGHLLIGNRNWKWNMASHHACRSLNHMHFTDWLASWMAGWLAVVLSGWDGMLDWQLVIDSVIIDSSHDWLLIDSCDLLLGVMIQLKSSMPMVLNNVIKVNMVLFYQPIKLFQVDK